MRSLSRELQCLKFTVEHNDSRGRSRSSAWRTTLVQTPVRNLALAYWLFILENKITILVFFVKAQLKFLYEFVQFCIEKEGLFQEDQMILIKVFKYYRSYKLPDICSA